MNYAMLIFINLVLQSVFLYLLGTPYETVSQDTRYAHSELLQHQSEAPGSPPTPQLLVVFHFTSHPASPFPAVASHLREE